MFVVAVAHLAGDLDSAAEALGKAADVAPFDVRARLGGPLPRVLFQSKEMEEARRVMLAARSLGHGVVACDSRTVVPSQRMVHVRRFALDETFLWANAGGAERLELADVAAIVACATRTAVMRSTVEKDLVTFGAHRRSYAVDTEHTRHEHAVDYAAYVFPMPARDGDPEVAPFLLQEGELKYVALGPSLRPTRRENFMLTLELLRARTRAPYDDRFLAHPGPATHLVRARDHDAVATGRTDGATDLTAHLLALWLTQQGSPYRQ